MEIPSSPVKKVKTPTVPTPLNDKTSISCTNVPEGLFDPTTAKKHFSKFGKVQRIRLFPKKQMCIIEYDQVSAVEKALLNAGAFDGFMFDVTRTKTRLRKRSKKEDDPDWVPDADVEQELSALSETPVYRLSRQKPMDLETEVFQPKPSPRAVKHSPIRKRLPARDSVQPTSGIETPVAVAITQTSMSTLEAALEINQLRLKVSLTPDEQWRILDARDRILRAWGGAGSRVKVGGATIGTCPDMCPEKELLHRQAEHQVMTLETVLESDGALEPWRAVKQYSRSSADQEMPMCYELRPARVLMNTCAYLLHEIADTTRPVSLADWFHFMWDRFRGIRKDITQQALCCSESIQLVEICARFHAHCAARLADLENTQFDQKLNTDNLTKCLQTLKHMYADVGPEQKPREAEFRGYIALLNLGDSNFWWEIKQLPSEIQKSEDIQFAIKIFNALDNNNYIRFFRLIRDKATYLQACILLRYFNDVRARALARIVKAYAPRGGSRYPAEELMNSLAFESIESMKSFINHYGLRISKTDDSDVGVILDRNQFIEDSDPYPVARSIHLIECKRKDTVGKVIGGGHLPDYTFDKYNLYSSFRKDGKLKDSALLAEDLGYNTINDTNKDVSSLKTELLKLMQGNKIITNTQKLQETPTPPKGLFTKSDVKASQGKSRNPFVLGTDDANKLFSFKPAIPVASVDVIKNTPDKVERSLFSFSKPHDSPEQDTSKIFKINNSVSVSQNIFNVGVKSNENQEPAASLFKFNTPEVKSSSLFSQKLEESRNSIFKKLDDTSSSIFGNKQEDSNKNIFRNISNTSLFVKKDESSISEKQNVFGPNSLFSKPTQNDVPNKQPTASIFGQIKTQENESKAQSSIFNPKTNSASSLFSKVNENNKVFTPNGGLPQSTSPGSFFKNALAPAQNGSDTSKSYSIFPSKNKGSSVADNIFNSVNVPSHDVYEFNQKDQEDEVQIRKIQEERERVEQEKMRLEEIKKLEMQRLHEEKLKEERKREEERKKKEEKVKEEERRKLEEKRRKEEDLKQEELRKKLEEERKAEIKRKAEEEEKKFRERVEKESDQLIVELCDEITHENVKILIKEEMDKLNNLIQYAETTTEELLMELCNQVCESEVKAEKFLNSKIMKKWFEVWKLKVVRNIKRRNLLENTPVWLPHNTALEEASSLKRSVEMAALKNMNAIHRGYRFKGDIKQICYPKPYNVMEIIKSPLLKRMKQISYPYDKCFFWKTTIVSPGVMKWIHRKVELEPWLISVFSDGEKHQSDTLIYVGKQSWINLIDFAISISLIKDKNEKTNNEALEGSNGVLFYSIENDLNFIDVIKSTLSHKYPYQIIPVAVVLPQNADDSQLANLDQFLAECVKCNSISTYRIFFVEKTNVHESLNKVTKSALKWLAKKYPTIPPLEIDNLKSLCQRYLANEIWFKLRSERDNRIITIAKDIRKLIQCYNEALDRLTKVITNEDLFNYPSFPLEFTDYLYHASPYPKPFEFISSIVKNSDNLSAIKSIMSQLKLPSSITDFQPKSVASMQDQIRTYCNEIGWFENPEEVVCKVVAVLPNELSDSTLPCENFDKYYEQYDLIDFLNIIVYEKISSIRNFDNVFAIYEKSSLEEYRSLDWLFSIDVIAKTKHKALEYEDDIDLFIKAKRRKIASESMEYLMLEDKDRTIVEENIKAANETILKYANCGDAVDQLEKQIELERIKSMELEMLLQSALSDV